MKRALIVCSAPQIKHVNPEEEINSFITKPTLNPRGVGWTYNFLCGRCASAAASLAQISEAAGAKPACWAAHVSLVSVAHNGEISHVKPSWDSGESAGRGFFHSKDIFMSLSTSFHSSSQTYLCIINLHFISRHLKATWRRFPPIPISR